LRIVSQSSPVTIPTPTRRRRDAEQRLLPHAAARELLHRNRMSKTLIVTRGAVVNIDSTTAQLRAVTFRQVVTRFLRHAAGLNIIIIIVGLCTSRIDIRI